jgi:hypothetical protein
MTNTIKSHFLNAVFGQRHKKEQVRKEFRGLVARLPAHRGFDAAEVRRVAEEVFGRLYEEPLDGPPVRP